MGVNTIATLPGHTDLDDILFVTRKLFPEAEVTTRAYDDILGMTNVTIQGADKTLVDGDWGHSYSIHANGGEYGDEITIYCGSSTPFWIAFCRRLCQVFGGRIDHNDCDDSDCDEKYRAAPRFRRSGVLTERDEHQYGRLRYKLDSTQPLTYDEIVTAAKEGRPAYTLKEVTT